MSNIVGTVNLKLNVTQQQIDDIMCTALDSAFGGSNYWVYAYGIVDPEFPEQERTQDELKELYDVEYKHDALSKNAKLNIFVIDDDSRSVESLTLDSIVNALRSWVELRQKHNLSIQLDDDGIDTGDIDAADADSILQLAIFGEIRYG